MIDWNNNGKVDPEEFFLTEAVLGEDEDQEPEYEGRSSECPRFASCLPTPPIMPIFLL